MIRKLAPYTKGYRIWIILGVLCSAGEAVLELLLPKAMSQIVDVGIANGDKEYILAMGLKMILMALASLVMGVGAAALAARAGMGFGANVRAAEYAQVQRFSFANIEHFSTASLITRLTNDVSSVQMTLMMGMRMLVRAPVMLITALVMALTIGLQLSQVFLVVLPLLLILVAIVIRYVGPFFTALQKSTDDLNLVVQEDLNAIRVVKSFVREDREQEKFAQRSDTLRDTAERAYSFVVLFVPLVTLIMGGTIMAIMWLGGHYVVGGSMLSGDLIAFFTYASEILMSLMMVAMVMMVLTRSIACGKRIVEVLEEQPEITDSAADPALTVENGVMTFHVSLASKKIVNLYVGMAADAEANKADWLLPTTDTVTYSDGTSEEVYGYDIPVAAVDQDFQLALLGTKGKWYDHTVSIRNAQPKAEEAAETPADGEYSVNVTLEGGSGRATVESPAALTVADGKMTAVILWSSPNYDYMIVDGEKYLPTNTEGNSTFEIPVSALGTPLAVTADTVAMSTPHEIEYTLTFALN